MESKEKLLIFGDLLKNPKKKLILSPFQSFQRPMRNKWPYINTILIKNFKKKLKPSRKYSKE